MKRLSTPLEEMAAHYAVVVVGSGYGGGVAAARLARTGQAVCLLERGQEIPVDQFPDTREALRAQFQGDLPDRPPPENRFGSRQGLFDCHVDQDMGVLRACGLGGTSLISAQVIDEPSPDVFNESCWPRALIDDLEDGLRSGFDRAIEALDPGCFSPLTETPSRARAVEQAAEAAGFSTDFPRLAITERDRVNAFGIPQGGCLQCGECLAGCRRGAANTVAQTYLQDAWQHNADLFTGVMVRRVERTFDGRQWRVYYVVATDDADFITQADERFVTADCVVLSAGALGTTEILLRSADHGLSLSPVLGQRFSGNGNRFGVSWNGESPAGMTGSNDSPERAGPAVSRRIDLRAGRPLDEQLVIHDIALPSSMADDYVAALSRAEAGQGSGEGGLQRRWRKWLDWFGVSNRGALAHSSLFLACGHDSAAGSIALHDDQLRIQWPGAAAEAVFDCADKALKALADAVGAVNLNAVKWQREQASPIITWHPLGGCPMGNDADSGVVDHAGRVFHGDADGVHEGLYVTDGSILPMSLGTAPALTIAALAERNAALIARDMGWTISETAPIYSDRLESEHLSARLQRELRGYWLPGSGSHADFRIAADTGRDHGHIVEMTLRMTAEDLEQALTDERLVMTISGEVFAPRLGDDRLTIQRGEMTLRARAGDSSRHMEYRGLLEAPGGKRWRFRALGQVSGFTPELVEESTHLYITIESDEDDGEEAGNGIVSLSPERLVAEMGHIAIIGAGSREESGQWLQRMGQLLYGPLWAVHGPVSPLGDKLRFTRPLRCGAPQWRGVDTPDGATLQLLNYPGDGQPVLLIHRPGASSRLYSLDTLNTCLVEALHAQGRDVWLLDDRSSAFHHDPDREAGRTALKQLAEIDYPEALAWLRRATGAKAIDVIAEGAGADLMLVALMKNPSLARTAVLIQPATPDASDATQGNAMNPAARALAAPHDEPESRAISRQATEMLTKAIAQPPPQPLPPITAIHGEKSLYPATDQVLQLLRHLREHCGPQGFEHHVAHGYHALDCLLGRDASTDIYPHVIHALDAEKLPGNEV